MLVHGGRKKESLAVHVRWMIRRDMVAVLEIERESFGRESWVEEDFLRCLRQNNCIGMVAEDGDTVAGFMIYELSTHKLNIRNFAVHPRFRMRSVGRQLVEKLQSKLSEHRRRRITLDVRESNLPAQLFFRRMGFLATEVNRDFYENGDDAYAMEFLIGRDAALMPESEDAGQPPSKG